jgi:hypothetical protein
MELGIDPVKAAKALFKHAGDFDLACSTASKDFTEEEKEVPREAPKEAPADECRFKHGRGRGRGGRGGFKGPFGGHGGHGEHPMRKMIQEFFTQLTSNGASSSSSDSEEERQADKKREEQRAKRPAIVQTSDQLYPVSAGETVFVEVTIENKTKWPCNIEAIKKIEPSTINFEGLEVGQKLKHLEQSKLSIPITMPSQTGHFGVKLGFFSKKG